MSCAGALSLALHGVRWIRLVKHGGGPTDLPWQLQPNRAGAWLLPGRLSAAAWARPRASFRAGQAKPVQPWPQVFQIKGSTGASGVRRKCQAWGSVRLHKVPLQNCRPVLQIRCKQFGYSHMGNLWQAGNTTQTVLITRLSFPDTHLLSYVFLYQKHSLCMSIMFPHSSFTRVGHTIGCFPTQNTESILTNCLWK